MIARNPRELPKLSAVSLVVVLAISTVTVSFGFNVGAAGPKQKLQGGCGPPSSFERYGSVSASQYLHPEHRHPAAVLALSLGFSFRSMCATDTIAGIWLLALSAQPSAYWLSPSSVVGTYLP